MKQLINTKNDMLKELLSEIRNWTRLSSILMLQKYLPKELNDKTSLLIYHFSDGRSSRDVAKQVSQAHRNISRNKVIKQWRIWSKIGIVVPFKVKGGGYAYKKITTLENLGLEIP